MAAVADPSERVRLAVLRTLHATAALDDFLAQVRLWLCQWGRQVFGHVWSCARPCMERF